MIANNIQLSTLFLVILTLHLCLSPTSAASTSRGARHGQDRFLTQVYKAGISVTLSSSAECSSAVPKATARAKCSGKATLHSCTCLSSWCKGTPATAQVLHRDTAHISSWFSTAQNGARAPYSKLREGITLTLPETPTLLIPTQKLAGVKATETGSNKQDP